MLDNQDGLNWRGATLGQSHDGQLWRLLGLLLLAAVVVSAGVLLLHSRQAQADQGGDSDALQQMALLSDRQKKQGTAFSTNTTSAEIKADSSYLFTIPSAAENNALKLSASTAFIGDLNSGHAVYAKNPHEVRFPASTTKIVTAILAERTLDLRASTKVSDWAASVEPNRMGLHAGDIVPLTDILTGMLINSGNDAARTVADAYPQGADAFYVQMNTFAEALGLKESHFANSSGLDDPNHVSSPYDMAVFMRYLVKNNPELMPIMHTIETTIPATATHPTYYLKTLSSVLSNTPAIEAVKTGYTPTAGHSWVAVLKQGDRHIVIAFMNSWDSTGDAQKLMQYGLAATVP